MYPDKSSPIRNLLHFDSHTVSLPVRSRIPSTNPPLHQRSPWLQLDVFPSELCLRYHGISGWHRRLRQKNGVTPDMLQTRRNHAYFPPPLLSSSVDHSHK